MKTALTLFLCGAFTILIAGCSFAQADLASHTWTATIKIVDGNGNPVPGADVSVAYPPPRSPGQEPSNENVSPIKGLTDSNGMFVASHSSQPGFLAFLLGIRVQKPGYYSTWVQRDFGPGYNEAKWNPNITLVLKKIINPIPMYAKLVDSEPPIFKKTGKPPIAFTNSVGYDLVVGDWVAPYGKGINTDMIFTEEFNKKSITDYYYKLTISFPNKGDGIQEFTVSQTKKGSALRSPHDAPAEGYQPQLARGNYHHPGQQGKSDYDPNRNYFFRVRTVLDANGNVKSALYGKIYGDFMQFTYYLDPTPNDRNVEFDPKQNLLRGLKPLEQVREP